MTTLNSMGTHGTLTSQSTYSLGARRFSFSFRAQRGQLTNSARIDRPYTLTWLGPLTSFLAGRWVSYGAVDAGAVVLVSRPQCAWKEKEKCLAPRLVSLPRPWCKTNRLKKRVRKKSRSHNNLSEPLTSSVGTALWNIQPLYMSL